MIAFSKIDLVGNGFGRWNTIPISLRTDPGIDVGVVDVLPTEHHTPFRPCAWDDLVHPIHASQHGALPAAGRADQRSDLMRRRQQVHVRHGVMLAEPGVELLD